MEHLEGQPSVLAALHARQRRVHVILIRCGVRPERVRILVDLAEQRGVPVRYVARTEIDSLAHGASHGGVLAICSPKSRTSPATLLESVAGRREPALLLLLEGIDDARNLGFTLRSAEALGAHAVLVKKHLWDLDPIEVARPSAGAYERLALVQIGELAPLRALRRQGVQLVGCLAGAQRTIHDIDLAQPTLLAIGGEKRGLSGAVRSVCTRFATIPTRGGPTSLSLSHAAAIVLAEAARQRRTAAAMTVDAPET